MLRAGLFAVKGHVKGDATINLRALYYVDGALQSSIFPADRGSFAFKGRAPEGAVVEILDNDYRLLGRFYAVNGDEIDVTIDPKSPASAKVNKGSDIAVRWAQWLNANAKTIDSRNSKIINALAAKYVKAHPQDIVSTLIITTVYDASVDPEGASRLLSSIAPEARPTALTEAMATLLMYADTSAAKRRVSPLTLMAQGDTVTTFSPRKHRLSLLVFSDETAAAPTVSSRRCVAFARHTLTKPWALWMFRWMQTPWHGCAVRATTRPHGMPRGERVE